MNGTIKISRHGTTAEINTLNAQLFSLMRTGTEVMWNGGAPMGYGATSGWPNSEIVMFPIVGRAPNDSITINGKPFPMEKHGISRDMPWKIYEHSGVVMMVQIYEAGKEVQSTKSEHISVFPRSFKLTKSYEIIETGLVFKIKVENASAHTMPYSIGWHPAFRALENSTIKCFGKDPLESTEMQLETIRGNKGNVAVIEGCNIISYKTPEFRVYFSHNFGNTQIWDKGEGLVCIEPITAVSLSRSAQTESPDLLLRKDFKDLGAGQVDSFTAQICILSEVS